jgi:thioredoxin-like negative regulator of GroEL
MSESKSKKVVKKVAIEELETTREFKHYVRGRERVVVKWGMPKCTPCKIIAPTFQKLAETHPGLALAEAQITVPSLRSIVNLYKIDSVPIFYFFCGGKHIPDLTYQGIEPDKLIKNATALLKTDLPKPKTDPKP